MEKRKRTLISQKAISAQKPKKTKGRGENAGIQNYKSKQKKLRCKAKPLSTKKTVCPTNVERDKILEDDHHNDYNMQYPNAETEEFFTDSLNAETVILEKEIEENVENTISNLEHNLHNNILPRFSIFQKDITVSSATSESNCEDIQWEIIRCPYSATNRPPNGEFSPSILTTKLDTVSESMTNAMNQRDNDCFKTENRQQNVVSHNGFQFTQPKLLMGHEEDNHKTDSESIIIDTERDLKSHQDFCSSTAENVEADITEHFELHRAPTEKLVNNFTIVDSIETSHTSDLFLKREEEIELLHQQISSNLRINLPKKLDIDLITDINVPEIILEETECEIFPNRPSTSRKSKNENSINEMVLQRNLELRDSDTSSISEDDSNQFNIINKDLTKKHNSFLVNSKLKTCGHSNMNIDQLIIKNNRSKLKMRTPKYCVMDSNDRSKNKFHPKTNLQIMIKNTMKDTHPNLCLNDDIGMRLEIFLLDILHRIGDEAGNLTSLTSEKPLDKRMLRFAIKLAFEKMKDEADAVTGKRNQWLF